MNWWYEQSYPCPICGGQTRMRFDTDGGRLYESESECADCRLWASEFSYGHHSERVGWCGWEWGYYEDLPHAATMAACAELHRARQFSDFAAMWADTTPLFALADWLQENDFPIQLEAVRAVLVSSTLTESQNG